MLRPGNQVQVDLYADPVDMRESIDGLSALVEQEMELSLNMDALADRHGRLKAEAVRPRKPRGDTGGPACA